MEGLVAELYRLHLSRGLEAMLHGAGYSRIAGVDEAGRGCLAGPVVAAAVIVDPTRVVPGVDDSKRLGAERREELAELIRDHALAWGVAAVHADTIDRVNILQATRRAMAEALARLEMAPDFCLIDAVRLQGLTFPSLPVIRGDQISYAVASASILAKVDRDRRMRELDRSYPQYGFARHKGYAAREHLRALTEFGPCPAHRLTFRSVVPRVAEC